MLYIAFQDVHDNRASLALVKCYAAGAIASITSLHAYLSLHGFHKMKWVLMWFKMASWKGH